MKKYLLKHLLFLFITSIFFSSNANQNIKNDNNTEYKKANILVDSLIFYYDTDSAKYEFFAEQFNQTEFKSLVDSNFRQLFFDRTDFLRRKYKYKEAIPILEHAISIAREKKDTLSIATFYKMQSTLYYYLDNIDSTSAQLNKAYDLFKYLKNDAELGVIDIRKARIEYDLGHYDKAIEYSFIALELNKSAGDQQKMGISYLQLGNTYLYLSNYRDSKKYFELASLVFKKVEYDYGYYEAIANYGLVEIKEKQYRKGISKQFEALKYFNGKNFEIDAGYTYSFLVEAYLGMQQLDSSIYYNELAKKEFHKSNYNSGLCDAYLFDAKIYFEKKLYQKALDSALVCYKLASENSYNVTLELINYELYRIYKVLKNESKSYEHIEAYVLLKDSFNFNPYALKSDAMKYQLKAEEAQLKQQIAEERALIEVEKGEKTKQQLVNAIIISIVILLSFFISIYYLTKNRKLNKNLSIQRELISEELKVKESLLSEIHHRVKNNLQVINSMLNLQTQYITDDLLKKTIDDCRGRITSMSLIHESLYRKKDYKETLFSSYIEELLPRLINTYETDVSRVQLVMDIEPIKLSLDDSIPCGLIINEIVSNSLKHGFPYGKEGEIKIELKQKENKVLLTISDNGIGLEDGKTFNSYESFGFLLIEVLASQLEAELTINSQNGFSYHLEWENKAESDVSEHA